MTPIVQRFSSSANMYDKCRPVPPQDLIDFVRSMTPSGENVRVVDLGCGTGISSRLWSASCKEVTGLDPSEKMLEVARAATSSENVLFKRGWGHDIRLPDNYASIVTCASSFQWMEPNATLREVRRILRPGGVFAVYGPQVPPVAEGFYSLASQIERFMNHMKELDFAKSDDDAPRPTKWNEILQLLRSATHAKYCNEFCFHKKVKWTAAELCMWLSTVSYVNHQIAHLDGESSKYYQRLQDETARLLGEEAHTFYWCYRLILSIYE